MSNRRRPRRNPSLEATTRALRILLTDPAAAREFLNARPRTPATLATLDQAHAAADEAHQLLVATGAATGGTLGYVIPQDLPDWLLDHIAGLIARLIHRVADTCPHVNPRSPAPMFTAVHLPGLVVCARCTPRLAAHGIEDRRCDACGHVCAGVDAGDAIYPGQVAAGALTAVYGLCTACKPEPAELTA